MKTGTIGNQCSGPGSWRQRVPGTASMLATLLLIFWSAAGNAGVNVWLTDPDKSILFQKQPATLPFAAAPKAAQGATNEDPIIEVDESQTFQTMDGFGCCLTGGSAMHMIQMDAASRKALLK